MPLTPSTLAAGLRRRSLLAGALSTAGLGTSALVAGCTGDSGGTTDAEHTAAVRRARLRAARESEALLARYDGTAAAHTALAARLRPLRDAVARHAETLRAGASEDASRSPSGSPPGSASPGSPRPSATPSPSGRDAEKAPDKAAVPGDEKEALRALAGAERRLADSRTKALAEAPPELARLLASIAAADAAHAWLLDEEKPGDEKDGRNGDEG
ncbi:lipoprotein [Streptomyces albiaxialis]|uniref:Lipoprotein n=1 Tax=Streptomyces albiaxialis TaxID=329523 RepID=A0ABP5IRU0_9ACTN